MEAKEFLQTVFALSKAIENAKITACSSKAWVRAAKTKKPKPLLGPVHTPSRITRGGWPPPGPSRRGEGSKSTGPHPASAEQKMAQAGLSSPERPSSLFNKMAFNRFKDFIKNSPRTNYRQCFLATLSRNHAHVLLCLSLQRLLGLFALLQSLPKHLPLVPAPQGPGCLSLYTFACPSTPVPSSASRLFQAPSPIPFFPFLFLNQVCGCGPYRWPHCLHAGKRGV